MFIDLPTYGMYVWLAHKYINPFSGDGIFDNFDLELISLKSLGAHFTLSYNGSRNTNVCNQLQIWNNDSDW